MMVLWVNHDENGLADIAKACVCVYLQAQNYTLTALKSLVLKVFTC